MTSRFIIALIAALLVTGGNPANADNKLHPEVPLLDKDGVPVIESGAPLSTHMTCGGECHDTGFIEASSDHADAGASKLGQHGLPLPWQLGPGYYGGWDPIDYDTNGIDQSGSINLDAWLKRYGNRHVGGGPADPLIEMNCLYCHTDPVDSQDRENALSNGDFEWVNSASLVKSEIIVREQDGWVWNPEKFTGSGALKAGLLDIRKARDENCTQCHGVADNSLDAPLVLPADPHDRLNSERTGQLISPQKIVNSGLNIAGKESLKYAFDVHADRVVGCVNCHYSLNNPVYFRQREESRPDHLVFDPRRMSVSDYLRRPLHQFAKGHATGGLAADSINSLRSCESCHDAGSAHAWLPYEERHFDSLACESCHVPRLFGPGLKSLDWVLPNADRQAGRDYRNSEGDPALAGNLTHGFEPVLLPRSGADGKTRLSPFNLVTSWYWQAGDPALPVSRDQLEQAFTLGGQLHPKLIEALDRDNDGTISEQERGLRDETAVEALRARLVATGLVNPQINGEVRPYPVSHNVVNGAQATRECTDCHGSQSVIEPVFVLAEQQPASAALDWMDSAGVRFAGNVVMNGEGQMQFVPDASEAGFYVIGLHGKDWVDLLGLLMFLGVVAGVSVHAIARYVANRRREPVAHSYERVYMYDTYERLWHWLQAGAILLLLMTGLIIHKPQFFGMFSFSYVVTVHNVLGFIVLANAALALFYNLASGEIRQYLPEPRGFIARSVNQAMYYTRGIFAGDPHPLEKTKEHKLNPLQQVTYLGVLNVLLPAQVITGVMIWGLQEWPGIAERLGGFEVLAIVHTLVAWTFATFIVMHVYLTTAAGHKPTAGIKAMIEGWDEVEQRQPAAGPPPSRET